ncbi:hypothetical protein G8J22_02576 [Lentilactobacillus hilgardii]|uniref:hypothetical protein n=1 Tax=Lentilactobacillus hilgardii TaxID=1588 RepID=UPI00019C4F8A|nr:hypothetical protein [Lentilactobacillus hilgardii]EEI21155.1 hypothetical protein HMPREF0497_0053 [Lentilactobacillus buchneri ATCC 11577]MCT3396087.1 hypothetical protein [Lentilactobacillus hilgardii]QIR10565.1 hypothetical protein G8J22_02576 [Lentilactobacillus hilgardii]
MTTKGKSIMKLGKVFLSVIILLIICVVLLSTSPRNAVRLRMIHDGHPVMAITCNPYHDKDYSRYLNTTIYSISKKDQYSSASGNFLVGMYRIQRHSFLYTATPQPDIVK